MQMMKWILMFLQICWMKRKICILNKIQTIVVTKKLLLKTGGSNIDKTVRNFLNSTLSNEIGEIFTWTGIRKESKKMNGTEFTSLIVSTYSNNLNATVQSVENAIAVWLRRTSDRINNVNKSKNAQSAPSKD